MGRKAEDARVSRTSSPTRVLGALIVVLTLTSAACTAPSSTEAPRPITSDTTVPDPTEPDPAPRPDPAPDPSAPGECDPTIRTAIGATVGTQIDAFATEDFTTAYGMTSPFFRRMFAEGEFEALIRTDYPELVGNGGHRFDECRVRSRRAFIVVGVRSGAREVVLRYDLSEEADGWRIDGAGRLTGVTLPPDRLV
jgi:hypothetical protein